MMAARLPNPLTADQHRFCVLFRRSRTHVVADFWDRAQCKLIVWGRCGGYMKKEAVCRFSMGAVREGVLYPTLLEPQW